MDNSNVFEDAGTGANTTADDKPSAVSEDLRALQAERDTLAEEKADLAERLLRTKAEFDNFRRRTDREKADIGEYAVMESLRALLPVIDDFERALKMTAGAESGDQTTRQGLELIRSRLLDGLRKIGLEPIKSVGGTFDPHHHEAIERVPSDEAEDQAVLDEFQRGYLFKGRLLRPAMVKVAVRS